MFIQYWLKFKLIAIEFVSGEDKNAIEFSMDIHWNILSIWLVAAIFICILTARFDKLPHIQQQVLTYRYIN